MRKIKRRAVPAPSSEMTKTMTAPLWRQQCEAARNIEAAFGVQAALVYLVGEKFLNYLEASDEHVALRADIRRSLPKSRASSSRGNSPSIWNQPVRRNHSTQASTMTRKPSRLSGNETFAEVLPTCSWSNEPRNGCWRNEAASVLADDS